jgi:TRAP-type C4-dicarboxylate transport system permease small subunit
MATISPIVSGLKSVQTVTEHVSKMAVWAAGAMLYFSVFFICYGVVVRKYFNMADSGSVEISGYILAISTTWALAYGAFERINVRVDVLYGILPPKLAACLDWLSVAAMSVFIAYLTYYAFVVLFASWDQGAVANTNLATPLWIPQSLWVAGLVWMCVVLLLRFTYATAVLLTGDLKSLRRLFGPRTTLDEASEEAKLAVERTTQE